MAKKKNEKKIKDPNESITKRLDAVIRVIVETLDDKKFNEGVIVRILNSCGLTPTEIAKILGKKGPTAVSPYLYSKGKSTKKSKKLLNEEESNQVREQ